MNDNIYKQISYSLMAQDASAIYKIVMEISRQKPHSASVLVLALFPYFTACAEASIALMEKYGDDGQRFTIKSQFESVLVATRNKTKLFRDKTKKNLNEIEKIREEQAKEFISMLKFPFLKKIGCFYDLGTYTYHNKYIGNTFMYKWFFDELEKTEVDNPYLDFSTGIGEWCMDIVNEINLYDIDGKYSFEYIGYKNFNITLRSYELFLNNLDKGMQLYLFHIICSLNFVLYYLPSILNEENALSIRIKYLVYYFGLSSLKSLCNYMEQNKFVPLEKIKLLIVNNDIYKSEFCNCMRHYEITEKDMQLEDIKSDSQFFGLIEKYFKLEVSDFINVLNNNIKDMVTTVEHLVLI